MKIVVHYVATMNKMSPLTTVAFVMSLDVSIAYIFVSLDVQMKVQDARNVTCQYNRVCTYCYFHALGLPLSAVPQFLNMDIRFMVCKTLVVQWLWKDCERVFLR
jgi:hypothetical protein